MSYANLLLKILYHIVIEMNIRESCLQTWTFIYKPGISVTKQDFHLQTGILGLQMGFSGYYLPLIIFHINITCLSYYNKRTKLSFHLKKTYFFHRILQVGFFQVTIRLYSFLFVKADYIITSQQHHTEGGACDEKFIL